MIDSMVGDEFEAFVFLVFFFQFDVQCIPEVNVATWEVEILN
jgi:hypothetical protein